MIPDRSTKRFDALRCKIIFASVVTIVVSVNQSGCRILQHPVSQRVAHARWLTNLGIEALNKQQLEQATGCFTKACDVCPDDQRIRLHLAEAHRQKGAIKQAIAELIKVLPVSDNPGEVHRKIGELYLLDGQIRNAQQHADNAIYINRNDPAAWKLHADLQLRKSNFGQAVTGYNRALSVDDSNELASNIDKNETRYQLARALTKLERHQRALTTLESIANEYPAQKQPERLVLQLSEVLVEMNLLTKASEKLKTACSAPQASPEAFVALGKVQQKLGDWSAAQLTLLQAQQRYPNHQLIKKQIIEIAKGNHEIVNR